jgi:hypothetical protein
MVPIARPTINVGSAIDSIQRGVLGGEVRRLANPP